MDSTIMSTRSLPVRVSNTKVPHSAYTTCYHLVGFSWFRISILIPNYLVESANVSSLWLGVYGLSVWIASASGHTLEPGIRDPGTPDGPGTPARPWTVVLKTYVLYCTCIFYSKCSDSLCCEVQRDSAFTK